MIKLTATPSKHWFWEAEEGIDLDWKIRETERGRGPTSIRRNLCSVQWTRCVWMRVDGSCLWVNQISEPWLHPHPPHSPYYCVISAYWLTDYRSPQSLGLLQGHVHVIVRCVFSKQLFLSLSGGAFVLRTNGMPQGTLVFFDVRDISRVLWYFAKARQWFCPLLCLRAVRLNKCSSTLIDRSKLWSHLILHSVINEACQIVVVMGFDTEIMFIRAMRLSTCQNVTVRHR